MPRKARKYIIIPGAVYHIVARGNNERRIFRSSRDYNKLRKILAQVKIEMPFYLYCYSSMPNHFHLEIETIDVSISKIMHRVNSIYAVYFRRRYKISGHLFQGRFFSAPITQESYFWAVARYIDLNAVRAKLVKNPEDYPYGSFRYYFQKEYKEQLIDRERFLRYGGENFEEARLNYIELVKRGAEIEQVPSFIAKNFR